jgi:thiol-disulfide isomerase/thioredoxin
MVPTFEELSEKFGDSLKFCLVNTDEQKGLRIKFAVAAFPYIVYVANGLKTPLFDEFVTADKLEERIRFVLEGGEAPTTRPL